MRTLVAIFSLTACFSCLAAGSQPAISQPHEKNLKIKPGYIVCPSAQALTLNRSTMMWGAAGGWKTFAVSFATKITHFLGAQWEGVNLGNIYCLYQGNKMTFDINLQHPGLVSNPSAGRWSKNLGGFKNCVSKNRFDCQFKPFKKAENQNLYQTLTSLKANAPQQPAF